MKTWRIIGTLLRPITPRIFMEVYAFYNTLVGIIVFFLCFLQRSAAIIKNYSTNSERANISLGIGRSISTPVQAATSPTAEEEADFPSLAALNLPVECARTPDFPRKSEVASGKNTYAHKKPSGFYS
jgi:hypothetical protein